MLKGHISCYGEDIVAGHVRGFRLISSLLPYLLLAYHPTLGYTLHS